METFVINDDNRIGHLRWLQYGEPGANGMTGEVEWFHQRLANKHFDKIITVLRQTCVFDVIQKQQREIAHLKEEVEKYRHIAKHTTCG